MPRSRRDPLSTQTRARQPLRGSARGRPARRSCTCRPRAGTRSRARTAGNRGAPRLKGATSSRPCWPPATASRARWCWASAFARSPLVFCSALANAGVLRAVRRCAESGRPDVLRRLVPFVWPANAASDRFADAVAELARAGGAAAVLYALHAAAENNRAESIRRLLACGACAATDVLATPCRSTALHVATHVCESCDKGFFYSTGQVPSHEAQLPRGKRQCQDAHRPRRHAAGA